MKPVLALLVLLLPARLLASENLATILCYHEVDAAPTHATIARRSAASSTAGESRRYTASPASFAAQLDELERSGRTVVPLSQLVETLAGCRNDLPPDAVVITVDDGWACAYTDIYPELARRNLPWTLFIYPKIVGRGSHAVTWTQVEEMARAGVDIQNHSMTHPFLTRTNNHDVAPDSWDAFVATELLASRRRIEGATASPVRFFCYPFGDHDAATADLLTRYGYEAAVTTVRAPVTRDTPLMRLPRYLIHDTTTIDEFRTFLH